MNELEKVNEEFDLNSLTHEWLETCEQTNGTSAVETIQDSMSSLGQCVLQSINVANLLEEIKTAAPRGALDEVFTHYCDLVPKLKSCRDPLTESSSVCLSDQSVKDLDIFNAAIDGALDFVCYKGGERIAIFLAESGTECIMSNADQLNHCLNDSLPIINSVLENIQKSNTTIYNHQNCRVETNLKTCIVNALKNCSDPTPSNIIEGLIDSFTKETPCYIKSGASSVSLITYSFAVWLSIISITLL